MTYRYVKAPPGFTLELPLSLGRKLRYGLSLVLVILGIATFTTVAYPLIAYQLTFAPRFQKSALLSPLSPSVVATQDLINHPVKSVKAQDSKPAFVDEVVNTSLDYTDANSWFTQNPVATSNSPYLVYTLSIPKLGIDRAVVRTDHTDLKQSLIQYGGTALPGDLGNTVIFGHSVLPQFFNPKNYLTIFSTLHTLRPGDTIELAADGATYTYKISDMYEAAPDDLSPLAQVYDGRYLTLITCTPRHLSPPPNYQGLCPMTKYLGIDYGQSHVGLATSEHMLATPLVSLDNDGSLIPRLAALVQKEGITHLICGLPEGVLVPKVQSFAKDLQTATRIEVILHPETLSTKEAVAGLRAGGASRAKLQNDHVYAACLILEDYLELKNSVN